MRARELDAAVAACNPVEAERLSAFALADRGALLAAVAAEPTPLPAARPGRGAGPVAALILLFALALAAAGVFTAPGGAVAGWVGDRLGIGGPGEPGGPPALRQLNEGWAKGTDLEGRDQYVLVVGPVTGRERSRYEFITYDREPPANHPGWPDGPCFKLDLTQERSMYSQGCGVLPNGGEFAYSGVGGGHGTPYRDGAGKVRFRDELSLLSGRVGPRVAVVEARVDGRPVPVQLRPIPAGLRERLGLGGPFGFFVGFFSGTPRGGTVEVTARAAGGEPLGRARTELPDKVEAARMSCRVRSGEGPPPTRQMRRECAIVSPPAGR